LNATRHISHRPPPDAGSCPAPRRVVPAIALAAVLFPAAAFGVDLDPALDNANPLAPFAQFLGSALVTKILLWMGACRAVGKLVSTKLQELLDAAVQFARGTADESDDHWINSILGSRAYRVARFWVDYFFSVKLPTLPAPEKPMTTTPSPAVAALLVAACLALTGCSTSRVAKTSPDGTKISAFNSRFIWSTEGFSLTYNTNGSATVTIQRSNPDAETMGKIAEGAARGATK
jgi:hypothetical protein